MGRQAGVFCDQLSEHPANHADSCSHRLEPDTWDSRRHGRLVELTRLRGHLRIGAGKPPTRSPHAENPTALPARVSRGSG